MSIEEKVNYYYKEIIDRKNSVYGLEHIKYNELDTKEVLKVIIESNDEHLLTPAFIYYLVCNAEKGNMPELLQKLTNDNTKLYLYQDYLAEIYRNFPLFSQLLNKYELEIYKEFDKTSHYSYALTNIVGVNHASYKDLNLLGNIIRIMTAYVIVNNKEAYEIEKYIKPYFDNLFEKIEELLLQGVIKDADTIYNARIVYIYVYEDLIDYILGKMDDNQKEIR